MEAIPKSDIKSVIKSDIRFDISIKQTTWIGHKRRRWYSFPEFGMYQRQYSF